MTSQYPFWVVSGLHNVGLVVGRRLEVERCTAETVHDDRAEYDGTPKARIDPAPFSLIPSAVRDFWREL